MSQKSLAWYNEDATFYYLISKADFYSILVFHGDMAS